MFSRAFPIRQERVIYEMMREQWRQNRKIFIKLSVTAFLAWLIWRKIDPTVMGQLFHHVTLSALAMAALCLGVSILFASRRWYVLLNAYDEDIPQKRISRITFIGFFFSQGLPSSIGGDVYRIYAIKDRVKSLSLAMMSIFLERLYGLISLILIALIALGFQYTRFADGSLWYICFLSLGIIVTIIFSLWVLPRLPLQFICQRVPLLKEAINVLRETRFTFRQHIDIVFWTLLSHIAAIYCFIVIAQGLQIPFGWREALIVVPLTFIVGTLPISFAGWGVREGIMVYALAYFGIAAEAALSLSVLYGIIQLMVAGLGLGLWLRDRQHISPILQPANKNQY